jgi:hypothetical protein
MTVTVLAKRVQDIVDRFGLYHCVVKSRLGFRPMASINNSVMVTSVSSSCNQGFISLQAPNPLPRAVHNN